MSILHLQKQRRLSISTFGMVDTNCDPNKVDFAIPANDDATKSIAIIVNYLTAAIAEGLQERQADKEEEDHSDTEESAEAKAARFEQKADGGDDRNKSGGGRGTGGRCVNQTPCSWSRSGWQKASRWWWSKIRPLLSSP